MSDIEFSATKIFDYVATDQEGWDEAVPGLPFIGAILLSQLDSTRDLVFKTTKQSAGRRLVAMLEGTKKPSDLGFALERLEETAK